MDRRGELRSDRGLHSPPAGSVTDRLKFDYEQTVGLIKILTETRYKLMALVPTLTAAGVALLTGSRNQAFSLSRSSEGIGNPPTFSSSPLRRFLPIIRSPGPIPSLTQRSAPVAIA